MRANTRFSITLKKEEIEVLQNFYLICTDFFNWDSDFCVGDFLSDIVHAKEEYDDFSGFIIDIIREE